MRVAFENPAPREVSADKSLTFVCHINRGLIHALENSVEIVRRSVDNTETILTQAAKRVEAEPAFYNVKIVATAENTIRLEFEIIKGECANRNQGFLNVMNLFCLPPNLFSFSN